MKLKNLKSVAFLLILATGSSLPIRANDSEKIPPVKPGVPVNAEKKGAIPPPPPLDENSKAEPKKPKGWRVLPASMTLEAPLGDSGAIENAQTALKSVSDGLAKLTKDEELGKVLAQAVESGNVGELNRNPRLNGIWGEGCIPIWHLGKPGKGNGDEVGSASLKIKWPKIKISGEINVKLTIKIN